MGSQRGVQGQSRALVGLLAGQSTEKVGLEAGAAP